MLGSLAYRRTIPPTHRPLEIVEGKYGPLKRPAHSLEVNTNPTTYVTPAMWCVAHMNAGQCCICGIASIVYGRFPRSLKYRSLLRTEKPSWLSTAVRSAPKGSPLQHGSSWFQSSYRNNVLLV